MDEKVIYYCRHCYQSLHYNLYLYFLPYSTLTTQTKFPKFDIFDPDANNNLLLHE